MRRLLAGIAAAALGLGVLVWVADSASAETPASKSVAVLMKSYDAKSGRIGGGWWTGAVALSTVMTYRQATGDSQYDYAISGAFAKNSKFTNEYIDDTGWWALVWLQAYDITGNKNYLNMAETTTKYMHSYWDSKCGGGVYWSTAMKYKASIANELFLAATAGLHNRLPGDTTYLGWADDEWNWFKGTGLISSNLVRDGLNVDGCGSNNATFTYNQGVVLQGLSELSKATGNTALLSTAGSIATAATQKFNRNGVLYEGCEPNCTGDGQSFKGIFIRYLRTFATTTNTTQYNGFITTTANSILANDTDSAGQQGNSFVGPNTQWTYNTQATAAAALVAALGTTAPPAATTTPPAATTTPPVTKTTPPVTKTTPPVTTTSPTVGTGPVFGGETDLMGHESGRCVDVPRLSQTNGTLVKLWDCNGGKNQNWTVTSSGRLTIYAGTKCLDVTNGGTTDGTSVQIWDCNGGTNQQWTVNTDGTIVGVGSGKCLDANAHGISNGTKLQIWTCNGGSNQKWSRD